ncbi:MAG: DUF1624 domain-containing protein [Acidobacteria bacterium]|nr:DUF1624 domain-containing protein [Acidobacteriota bacterium]
MNQENPDTSPSNLPLSAEKILPRLDSIDVLRGIVMVVMALDHTRDYFSNAMFDPTDLTKTNSALFLTRFVTHFCASVFVFLAGTAAFLSTLRGKTQRDLARFLLTRGLWLVLLELTVIRCLGWDFNFDYHNWSGLVIWAIGWSMVALAGLIFLPQRALVVFGLVMILGHNALDKIQPERLGAWGWLWKILHVPGALEPASGFHLYVMYPLIPWIGVMAVGYGFGKLLLRESQQRQKLLFRLGAVLTLSFVILRAVNVYGDPVPWAVQKNWWFTVFSFLNCTKYPPSLLYLLMTLGPALMALAWLDKFSGRWRQPFLIIGRVPLFYYLLHLPLIHLMAVIFSWIRYGHPAEALYGNPPRPEAPSDFGYSLPIVYLVWIGIVVLLYPACRWFADLKKRRKEVWLSYL